MKTQQIAFVAVLSLANTFTMLAGAEAGSVELPKVNSHKDAVRVQREFFNDTLAQARFDQAMREALNEGLQDAVMSIKFGNITPSATEFLQEKYGVHLEFAPQLTEYEKANFVTSLIANIEQARGVGIKAKTGDDLGLRMKVVPNRDQRAKLSERWGQEAGPAFGFDQNVGVKQPYDRRFILKRAYDPTVNQEMRMLAFNKPSSVRLKQSSRFDGNPVVSIIGITRQELLSFSVTAGTDYAAIKDAAKESPWISNFRASPDHDDIELVLPKQEVLLPTGIGKSFVITRDDQWRYIRNPREESLHLKAPKFIAVSQGGAAYDILEELDPKMREEAIKFEEELTAQRAKENQEARERAARLLEENRKEHDRNKLKAARAILGDENWSPRSITPDICPSDAPDNSIGTGG